MLFGSAFSFPLGTSSCPRSCHHSLCQGLEYQAPGGSVNLMESRASLSRKYLVQKKIMDFNIGAKFLGEAWKLLSLSFLSGWPQFWSRHLTYASKAEKCHAYELIRNIMGHAYYWSYLPGSVWHASCCLGPPREQHISETSPIAAARLSP